MIEGRCLCGAVRIEVLAPPRRVGICHCLDCRRHHGAVFAVHAIFAEGDVRVSGETRSYDDRSFCPVCGASTVSRSPGEAEVPLGLFPPDSFAPGYELWTCRRESWLPEIPGLVLHDKDAGD